MRSIRVFLVGVAGSLLTAPVLGQFETVINVPPESAPANNELLNAQLNLFEGGRLPAQFRVGSSTNFDATGELNILGGSVGELLNVALGGVVNMQSGSIEGRASVSLTGLLNIEGGEAGSVTANRGSAVQLSGGSISKDVLALEGSRVSISSGEVAEVRTSGFLETFGGRVDQLIASGTAELEIAGGSLGTIVADNETTTSGGRFDISGGQIETLTTSRLVTISGGTITTATASGDALVSGGRIDELLLSDGTLAVAHGELGSLTVGRGSFATVSGGSLQSDIVVERGAQLSISGGYIDGQIKANRRSTVHLIGSDFRLTGSAVNQLLNPGATMIVKQRDTSVSASLAGGGGRIELDLSSDIFSPEATLILTSTLATPSLTCGDFDRDSDVDSADRTVQTVNWTGALEMGGDRTFADGDCDFDGDIDTFDQVTMIGNFTNAQQLPNRTADSQVLRIPEPSSQVLFVLAGLILLQSGRKRLQHMASDPLPREWSVRPRYRKMPTVASRFPRIGLWSMPSHISNVAA